MFILFFCVWLIFNGAITAEIVVFGLVIAAVMFAFMCKFMDHSLKNELRIYRKSIFMIRYVIVLVMEIVKANMSVIHLILTVKEQVEPAIVTFRTTIKSPMVRTLLANSITLTPGTITVSLEGDTYEVHCLDKSLADGIESSVLVKMLEQLEKEGD